MFKVFQIAVLTFVIMTGLRMSVDNNEKYDYHIAFAISGVIFLLSAIVGYFIR